MKIPINEVRNAFGRNLRGEDPEGCLQLEGFLSIVDGARIVDNVKRESHCRCDWFVFGNEDWYKNMDKNQINGTLLSTNAFKFLKEMGYTVTRRPENFDVVAYYWSRNKWVRHYGLYFDGAVVSKIGWSYILEHDIELVPAYYGDSVKFLTKRNGNLKSNLPS